MGCGASQDSVAGRDQQVNAFTKPTGTKPRDRTVSVSFAPPESAMDRRQRESLKSLDSIESVVLMSTAVGPTTDATYEHLSEEMKHMLHVIRCAFEVNALECERVRREAEERYEAELLAKRKDEPEQSTANMSAPMRARRAQNTGMDRPPTPTGYVTEEPSATAVSVRRTMDDIKKKFTSFFTSTDETEDTPLSPDRVPAAKYAPSQSDMEAGSTYQSSVLGTAHGSLASALTRATYIIGPNGEDVIEIDEKVIQRTQRWATDNIGVALRVLEVARRKSKAPVVQPGDASENVSTSGSFNPAAGGSESASSIPLTRLFVPTISADPLRDLAELPSESSLGNNELPGTTNESSSSLSTDASTTPRGSATVGGGIIASTAPKRGGGPALFPSGNRQETHLSKRNLDRLQERLAMIQATGITNVQRLDDLAESGHMTPAIQKSIARIADGGTPDGNAAIVPLRGRSQSRCDENLLFQELV